jgi:hypothetical protein
MSFREKIIHRVLLSTVVALATAMRTPPAAAIANSPTEAPAAAICSVRSFGAKGDGLSLDTAAINAAIISCNAKGGGRVVFEPGIYRTGTIYWLDNITLDLQLGSVILGSENLADYPPFPEISEWRNTALLFANHAKNIALVGEGLIDGNGRAFIDPLVSPFTTAFDVSLTRQGKAWAERMGQYNEGPVKMKLRPGVLVLALHSQNITVHGIHVFDAPNWGVKLMCSDHIDVQGVHIKNNLLIPNDDGLDASNSSNVSITDSDIEAGDDALVLGGPCADGWCKRISENITVNNVTLVSRSAAIRVGPAFVGVRNVKVSNVVIHLSNRAIAIQARSAEDVDNIEFSNVTADTRLIDGPWWGSGEPIAISVGKSDYVSWPKTTGTGYIRHIKFKNMHMTTQSPIVLYSSEPGHIRDVAFEDLSVTMQLSALTTILGGNLDLQPITPESLDMTAENLSAIFIHNANGVSFERTNVSWQGEFPDYYRHALQADHFDGLRVNGFQGNSSAGKFAAIHLFSGNDASITNAKTQAKQLVEAEDVTGLKQ